MPLASPVPTVQAAHAASRTWFLDNLKILLTFLVVAHHAAQAYGPTGGSWPVGQDERAQMLGPFIGLNSMFFMGLFFFVSGYFTPASLQRKGAGAFVTDRLLRLGLPVLAWLLIHRLIAGQWEWRIDHLWFVIDLLALNLLYAAWRAWRPATASARPASTSSAPPADWIILGFVLVLGAITALVRFEYPVDRWIGVLGIFPAEPAHWPQYLSLFLLGFWAWRTRWLDRLSASQGRRWALIAAAGAIFYSAHRLGFVRTPFRLFATGGVQWPTWTYATFEALFCVALCIGLLWIFRTHLDRGKAWLRTLAADSYGIYWVHVLPVVGIQLALRDAPLGPMMKFIVATTFGFAGSWAVSHFALRRGWLGRRVF